MSSKAMTIRIFDSKTDESVVIITDAKKSRIRELVAVKGSFWDIVKKMEDSLREEGCRYKCVFGLKAAPKSMNGSSLWRRPISCRMT